ncbi:circadian clock protein KaiC [Actinomadura sp. DC4]|uniref:circadian clock protein KaiC n=1 Tax=Actinomadura sp. DC4 TaxID=3055069 RepID=UPI0025B0FFFF|nr:circadian clock protein KaiC [Actinomadura sp. DC4]MDN3351500.1 circadian clock protein KaiC [Actinomadura sp. DC4]
MTIDAIERLPTGIGGFDAIALGGIPAGRPTLVTGTTGSGKTLFAVEFLARGILNFGQPGVFVTAEETAGAIRRNAISLGFDIGQWERDGLWTFVDASLDTGEGVETIGTYDLSALMARIEHAVLRSSAERVSFDSFGSIFIRFRDAGVIRHELVRIVAALKALGVTLLLTSERVHEYDGLSRYAVEEFVLDNVIVLRNVLHEERRRRTVEIVKFRGVPHRTGEWLFTIDPREGFVVIPLGVLATTDEASHARVPTGNAGLDRMVGGGLFRDAIALLTGPPGIGKTLTALQFANAGAPDERCLFCTFDETRGQLARNAASWGMDLRGLQAANRLHVSADYPEAATPEEHFLRLRHAIGDFQPTRVVIDTLSSLERVVSARSLLDFVIALTGVLREREITTLITAAPPGHAMAGGTLASAVEMASIADVTIMLRYVERTGDIQRAVAVMQTRGSCHDHAIRQVTIDDTGLHIGEPLPRVAHVLSGSAALTEHPPWPAETDPAGEGQG